MHPELLADGALLVSGHHGLSFASDQGDRIILDRCGGQPEHLHSHPLEAILLPDRLVLGHDGSERALTTQAERVGVKREEEERKAAEKAKASAAQN